MLVSFINGGDITFRRQEACEGKCKSSVSTTPDRHNAAVNYLLFLFYQRYGSGLLHNKEATKIRRQLYGCLYKENYKNL
jgi:hypothetical protein